MMILILFLSSLVTSLHHLFSIYLVKEVMHKKFMFDWMFLRAPLGLPQKLNVHICLVLPSMSCLFRYVTDVCYPQNLRAEIVRTV